MDDKTLEELQTLTKRFMESGNDSYRDALLLALSEAVQKLLNHEH